MPIKKKDGSTRWAVDYRALNKCLELDSYPLPKIQQLVERARGHKVYSALDAVSAYYTIKIEPDSRACTAFTSRWGLYQWKQGLYQWKLQAGHCPLRVFPVHSRSAQPPWDGWSPILPG